MAPQNHAEQFGGIQPAGKQRAELLQAEVEVLARLDEIEARKAVGSVAKEEIYPIRPDADPSGGEGRCPLLVHRRALAD